jgi:Cft2 family RNA processing exonuclease
MKLTDLNAPGGIGANCLLLQFDGLNILIDAGIHPKRIGAEALPRLDKLRSLQLDLIFLTHCHLDHVGALPVIAREHPQTPIIMSRDTEAFYRRMLRNSCTVMERQRAEQGITDYPLYSYRDITACNRQAIGLAPGQPRQFEGASGDRITFTLHRAGHIPGAVGILLEYHHRRIFHSGDVLFSDTPLLDGARFPEGPMDTVILETTRGATTRTNPREAELERLLACIRQTVSRGGSILIPTFALGRMQELITVFHAARTRGNLPRVPIYLTGLGMDLLNPFDRIARKASHLRLKARMVRELGAVKLPESHHPGREAPGIYLLSSGMMVENTPSWKTAAALLDSPRNTIAFVGYCDPDTPGGQLRKTRPNQPFAFPGLRQSVPARAHIEAFDLSSHADREDLLAYAMARNPRSLVLNHGDPQARDWFHQQIAHSHPACSIIDPPPLQTLTV